MISLNLSPREAAAVLSALVKADEGGHLDLERPKHFSDVREVKTRLAFALEAGLSRDSAGPLKPAMGEAPKRKRGRPSKPELLRGADALAAKCARDGHTFVEGRCSYCGAAEVKAAVQS